jgi:Family of unknown function (DUF6263)
MKTLRSLLSIYAPIACAVLVGCSKTDNTPPTGVKGVTPEGKMEMQFKWAVGKQYVMRMDLHQTSATDVPNMKQPMQQEVDMTQDYTISVLKELPDDGRELELEFTGMKMGSKMGNRVVISFDSAQDKSSDARNPVAPILRKMVGGKLKYVTDAAGRVVRLEGFQEFAKQITAGSKPDIQAMFSSMYSEGQLKMLCDVARMAPNRGVKPGDSWDMNIQEEMGNVGTIMVNAKLKFKDWEQHGARKCARIESTGEMTSKPAAATGTASPITIEIEKGKTTGTGWFDPDLGMVVESTADQTMTMKITAQGQTMTSRAKQTINFKVLDVADAAK